MLLHEKLKNKRIILASGSPRRHEIMKQADLPFVVAGKYHISETIPEYISVRDSARYLAEQKSLHYPIDLVENDILITADTVVVSNNTILGKPKDHNEAIEMIRLLSGNMHNVITGVAIRTTEQIILFDTSTKVWVREIDDDEIEYYVERYNPIDKAGAYGIQEWIGHTAITKIEGSFYNVMGLPIQTLYQKLKMLLA